MSMTLAYEKNSFVKLGVFLDFTVEESSRMSLILISMIRTRFSTERGLSPNCKSLII